jgi:hypothetical protein
MGRKPKANAQKAFKGSTLTLVTNHKTKKNKKKNNLKVVAKNVKHHLLPIKSLRILCA